MATFRRRAGKWQARIQRKGYPDQTKTFLNKSDAVAWARQVESELERGNFVDRSELENTTLAELLQRYLEEVTPAKKGAVNEAYRVRAWINEPLAKRFLSGIRSTDFAVWRDKRIKEGKSPNTVRLDLAVISHLFRVARSEWGFEALNNPIDQIKLPKLPGGRIRRLELSETEILLDALNETIEVKTIVQLAIETGMRRSELLSIEWDNLDLENRFVFLPDTKNGDSRAVPLSTRALMILEGIDKNPSGKVFLTRPHSVSQAFNRACKRAGLDNLRFHDLRHEATSRLFEKGLNTMEVSAITGHKTLGMLKRYTHLKASDLALKLG